MNTNVAAAIVRDFSPDELREAWSLIHVLRRLMDLSRDENYIDRYLDELEAIRSSLLSKTTVHLGTGCSSMVVFSCTSSATEYEAFFYLLGTAHQVVPDIDKSLLAFLMNDAEDIVDKIIERAAAPLFV